MKVVQKAITLIKSDIDNKIVLEMACGCAQFSISASNIAKEVVCIDLDSHRLDNQVLNCKNLEFHIMDATKTDFTDSYFDTVVIYNAIGHLQNCFKEILLEALRLKNGNGSIYIISTFKMDKSFIKSEFIEFLLEKNIAYKDISNLNFTILKI